MLSLVKAKRPPPTNTNRHSKMIGRRVNPNARRDLTTTDLYRRRPGARALARSGRERVAQEQGAVGGYKLARLQAFQDLVIAVALHSDLDRALDEMAAV